MNAPYDGDRGWEPGGDPARQAPPPAPGPHGRAGERDPWPVTGPGERTPRHREPASPTASAPSPWAPAPEPEREPEGQPGERPGGRAEGGEAGQDAFEHLFRDQRQPYSPQPSSQPSQPPRRPQGPPHHPQAHGTPPPAPPTSPPTGAPTGAPAAAPGPELPADPGPAPESAPAKKPAGRASSVLKSSAVMAAGTLVSRITGFLRTLVMAAAIGVGTLNDAYQVANTLPTMIYILVGGGALNAVFIPQLVRAMKNDDDGGEGYANRLLTLVIVLLAGMTTVCVLAAPLLIRMMSAKWASDPAQMDVAVAFARYCLPTMFFMGVHVVLGQILNSRGRFGAMMWTPVLNNVVIIATFGGFIWAFGGFTATGMTAGTITPEGVRLLGIGTLLGLTVQALAMLPYLRAAGFHFRPRFDWRGHGLGKAARLAKWTFFFVLANQLGMIVVTQLATWAGSVAENEGHTGTGITAYNYALLLWQMPQAIITVSVMTAVLPRISRAAADGDPGAVRDDLSYGMRTSAVAIVPCAFAFLALGIPMATLLYSAAGESGARNIGFTLMAFGLGLIPYSVQYVVLRGFYAYEDTRTPFYNTVIVAAVNAVAAGTCFLLLPARWAVVGMAASYGLAYAVGVGVAWKRLSVRLGGDLDGRRVMRTYARLAGAGIPAALAGGAASYGITQALGPGGLASLAALVAGGIVLLAVFVLAAKRMRIEEMTAMVGMVRGRLGR
ncbi:murein biosynthesis integral membrane protein MurJ [Streptomyces zingiberis]|uniref:Murein biosynthesis integral membrane protein MurJ n=1 Tax=Streptomyces zingiberis TaxID=2053010 RepID=A0ABX1BU03_9ACTN|nr:murein biosynthesis integral membrane protein MurJ [Streptomyces zingiberis]NJP99226.1 murein biosynthesis integral membrane protein MurJ [Streptomyces zingiberis]